VTAPAAVVAGIVYVRSTDGHLYALNAQTGHRCWRFNAEGEPLADLLWGTAGHSGDGTAPVVAGGRVYVIGRDLAALDGRNGAVLWRFLPEIADGHVREPSPAVVDGVVYVATDIRVDGEARFADPGPLYALDAETGAERWHISLSALVRTLVVADGVIYLSSYDEHLYALDAATGAERWRFSPPDSGSVLPTVVDATVFVGTGNGILYAFSDA
jgi:eukaryotic-like serine/threonine-protein kinase